MSTTPATVSLYGPDPHVLSAERGDFESAYHYLLGENDALRRQLSECQPRRHGYADITLRESGCCDVAIDLAEAIRGHLDVVRDVCSTDRGDMPLREIKEVELTVDFWKCDTIPTDLSGELEDENQLCRFDVELIAGSVRLGERIDGVRCYRADYRISQG